MNLGEKGCTVADLLITGGTVVTMAGANIEDGAIAVRGGEIVAVGPTESLVGVIHAGDTIDARGMAVLPGFVNAHTHAPMTLFRGIADDRELMDWLRNFIFPAEAAFVDPTFVRWGTRLAGAEMVRCGTTTFADMYYFEEEVAREARSIGLRAVVGQALVDFPAPDWAVWSEAMAAARSLVNEFRDDPMITPALGPHALYTVSREHLTEVRSLADELGAPILIHLAETESELREIADRSGGLSPVEYLDSIGFLGADVIAAHGTWLSAEDIRALAGHGVGIVHNPVSNMMLASGVAPVVEMRSAGIDVGLGTDGPAGSNNNLDMIEEMACAARLQKVIRKQPTALGARDVLEMGTIEGARVLGLADRVGSLEVGKRADIILIDLRAPHMQPVYSVESAIVYAAFGSDVVTTIVEGKVLMHQRELRTVDLPETLRMAEEYRDRLISNLS